MSLEILTSTPAGGSLDAPAAFSSATAEGAGSGMPFAALLDEQAGADEDLCPQIVEEPAELGCERTAETARIASGSSLSALGLSVPLSSDLTGLPADDPASARVHTAADDDDDAEEPRLDVVALPFTGEPTLADLLLKAESGGAGDVVSELPGDQVTVADDASAQLTGQVVSTPVTPAPEGAADIVPGGDIAEDLRQLAQAALRARAAQAYQQPAATRAAEAPATSATSPEAPAGQTARADSGPVSDLLARARAMVAQAAAPGVQPAGAGTPSEPDTSGDAQLLLSTPDRETFGAPVAPVTQPLIQFEAALTSASAPQGATLQTPAIPNEAHVASSIVQSMRLQMREGVGTAVVHLEPDYLGPVTINLRVSAGDVTATLHAENPQVRAWIEANEPMLRQALADQGLSLDRLVVTAERASEEQEAGQGRQPSQDGPPPRRQQKPDGSRTFEVIV